MKKVIALILVLCMSIAVLVACNDDATTESTTTTAAPQTSAPTTEEREKPGPALDDGDDDGPTLGEKTYYDETVAAREITIGSTSDWINLSKQSDANGFINTTIKLTADIDFGVLEQVPTLITTESFAGTFDGNGHTVTGKNLKANCAIAYVLDGGAEIKNVKFSGFEVKGSKGVENLAVVAAVAESTRTRAQSIKLTGITIEDCTIKLGNMGTTGYQGVGFVVGAVSNLGVEASGITVTATGENQAKISGVVEGSPKTRIGGVVGYMMSKGLCRFEKVKVDAHISVKADIGGVVGYDMGTGYFQFDKIEVKGHYAANTLTNGNRGVGGIMGMRLPESQPEDDSYIKNTYVEAELYNAHSGGTVGGLVGWWYQAKIGKSLGIENTYVKATISFKNGADSYSTNNIGGFVGSYGSYGSTLIVNKSIAEVALNQKWYSEDLANVTPDYTKISFDIMKNSTTDNAIKRAVYGYITAGYGTAEKPLTGEAITNCYTTIKLDKDGNELAAYTGLTVIESSQIAAMVQRDDNGFITGINAPA